MVIWLTGLSGAGKTTLGRALIALLRERGSTPVLVDGDEIRNLFRHDQGEDAYSLEGRRVSAERMASLCGWLDGQGLDVVCCCLSYFPDLAERNRRSFSRYFEVLMEVPIETLRRREIKNLYGPAFRGEIRNVVGVDLPFTRPSRPDWVVDNTPDGVDHVRVAREILARFAPPSVPGREGRVFACCAPNEATT